MAPPGESIFSTEFFDMANTCPHWDKYDWGLKDREFGILEERIVPMLMCIPYFFIWLLIRKVCKAGFPVLARALGLKGKKKTEKFSYQMWLGSYYLASTILGAWGYMDEPWFQFPIGRKACDTLFNKWPYPKKP